MLKSISRDQSSGGSHFKLKSISRDVSCDVVAYASNERVMRCITR